MSMKVEIIDPGLEVIVKLRASGGYSPDAMDDLNARAISAYKEALKAKVALGEVVDESEFAAEAQAFEETDAEPPA